MLLSKTAHVFGAIALDTAKSGGDGYTIVQVETTRPGFARASSRW